MTKNYLKFWGTRGSCAVSGPEYTEFGGNTPCLEVVYDGRRVILDAGTGIRPLGVWLSHGAEREFDIFLSHAHWDHLLGLPFFEPLHREGNSVNLWLPAGENRTPDQLVGDLLASDFFPVHLEEIKAKVRFHTTEAGKPVKLGPITIDFHRTQHPGIAHGFKLTLGKFVVGYFTDNEVFEGYHGGYDAVPAKLVEANKSLITFLKGCDLLIHEAQYTDDEYPKRVGWGHSSFQNALALVKLVGAKRWIVTHHEPRHGDAKLAEMERDAQAFLAAEGVRCEVEWARDGVVVYF